VPRQIRFARLRLSDTIAINELFYAHFYRASLLFRFGCRPESLASWREQARQCIMLEFRKFWISLHSADHKSSGGAQRQGRL